jgi:hypothetical protein
MRTRDPRRLFLIAIVLAVTILSGIPLNSAHAVSWSSTIQVPLSTPTNLRPSTTQDKFLNIWLAYESAPFGANPQSYYTIYNFIAWTSPVPITLDRNKNLSPDIDALSNGTIFLAWVSNRTGHDNLWYKSYNNGVWSAESQLTTTTSTDGTPSVVQDFSGNIWVFWSRQVLTGNSNLFYRLFTPGSGWSGEVALTTESNPIDILPSATVTADGRVWVIWSSFRTKVGYQLFIKFFNGASWSPDTQVLSYNGDDIGPTILQSGDGALWVAWSRDISLPGGGFTGNIYYVNSTNLGSTWSTPTPITNSLTFDSFSPAMLWSSLNQRLYLFWSSNSPAGLDFTIWYEISTAILIHDLAVTSTAFDQHKLFPGGLKSVNMSGIVRINATISNLGNYQDLAQTSVYANSTVLGSYSFSLLAGQSQLINTNWNTTGFKPGCYQITVRVAPAPGEVLTSNDVMVGGWVHILPFGDVDMDGTVNFIDASTVALAFQSSPGSPRWNPYADIDGDGFVSFLDVSAMAINYGILTGTC